MVLMVVPSQIIGASFLAGVSVPFFLIVAALAAAWYGHRQASLAFWAAGLLALLLLFRLHATEVLNLVL